VGRILSIVLAVISLLISLPGLLMTYRLFRIAISILIIWYLMQPQIKVLFQRRTPLAPAV
jgi:predicted membrane protein